MAFAKLFSSGDNQRLVKIDHKEDDSGPEVRVFFRPKGLGVCSVAFSWNDNSDESWDLAEKAFAELTEADVEKLVQEQLSKLSLKRDACR